MPVRVAGGAIKSSSCSTTTATDERDHIPTTTAAVLPKRTRSAATGRGGENGGLVRRALGSRRSVPASPERADDDEQEESDEAPCDDDPDVLQGDSPRSGGLFPFFSSSKFVGPGRCQGKGEKRRRTHHAGILTLPPVPDNRLGQIARTDSLFDPLGLAVGDDH